MKKVITWIKHGRKPKLGGEYLVVWELQDGGKPVTASMDYNSQTKQWTDPRNGEAVILDKHILYWAHLPKTPKCKS